MHLFYFFCIAHMSYLKFAHLHQAAVLSKRSQTLQSFEKMWYTCVTSFYVLVHVVSENVDADESKLQDNNNGDHEFAELRTCV